MLHYVRSLPAWQWHEVPIDLPYPVTATLVRALALSAELELGDVDQDIEEMADLCDELLNSDISIESLTNAIEAFAMAVGSRKKEYFEREILSEKVIKCLKKAIMCLPDSHEISIVLARSLFNRFNISPSDEDYQEGMAIVDKVITFRDSDDSLCPHSETAVHLAVLFAMARLGVDSKPEPLEQVIYRLRNLLDRTPLEGSYRAFFNSVLSYSQGLRLNDSSVTVDVEDLYFPSEFADLPSFRDLTASLPELNDITTPERLGKYLNALEYTTIDRLTDITDIEDGVKYCQQLLSSYADSELAPDAREALYWLFVRAWERTSQTNYLDEAISAARENINTSDLLMSDYSLSMLALAIFARFDLLHRREDLDESMQL